MASFPMIAPGSARHSRAWTASVLASVVLLAGCGDDGERLSRAAYVTAADAACTRAKTRIEQNTEKIPPDLRNVNPFGPDEVPADTLRRLAPTTEELGEIYRALRTDLQRVEPPADDEDEIAKAMRDLETGARRFEEAAASFRSGSRARGESPIALIAAPSRALADYGANSCLHSGN